MSYHWDVSKLPQISGRCPVWYSISFFNILFHICIWKKVRSKFMHSRILKIWIHMLFITLHRLFITRKTFHSLLITPHILFIRLHTLFITFHMLSNTFICCFPSFISWWTTSNYFHILVNTPFKVPYFIYHPSYVHEHSLNNLIC